MKLFFNIEEVQQWSECPLNVDGSKVKHGGFIVTLKAGPSLMNWRGEEIFGEGRDKTLPGAKEMAIREFITNLHRETNEQEERKAKAEGSLRNLRDAWALLNQSVEGALSKNPSS